MVTLLFRSEFKFPAGGLRQVLSITVPSATWTCGEDDDGTQECMVPFGRGQLIMGRASSWQVMLEVQPVREEDLALPAHGFRLEMSHPATDEPGLADKVAVVVAHLLSMAEEQTSLCQFENGGNWLSHQEVDRAMRLVAKGEKLASVTAGLGRPSSGQGEAQGAPAPTPFAAQADNVALRPGRSSLLNLPHDDKPVHQRMALCSYDILGMASSERTIATTLANQMGAAMAEIAPVDTPPAWVDEQLSRDRLPTIVALFSDVPVVDWNKLEEGVRLIDGEGDWSVQPAGPRVARLTGRCCSIEVAFEPAPVPAYLVEPALFRSFWCGAGPELSQLRRHRCHMTIASDLDCETAEFVDIRQSAKAMTMMLAVIAKSGTCAGVMNVAQGCAYTEPFLNELVGPLGQDEVPIKLFVWTAFPNTTTDAITLSTAGMLPFVGREVEVWNAPGTLEFVGEKLNGMLRYLLIEGPVIRHGDTIGEAPGDRSIRIYHEESREKSRPQSIPVLTMEFEGPGGSRPRADIPQPVAPRPAPPQPVPATGGLRRAVGGFGRKGL